MWWAGLMRGAVTIALSYNQVRHKLLTCCLNYDVWFLDFSLCALCNYSLQVI